MSSNEKPAHVDAWTGSGRNDGGRLSVSVSQDSTIRPGSQIVAHWRNCAALARSEGDVTGYRLARRLAQAAEVRR